MKKFNYLFVLLSVIFFGVIGCKKDKNETTSNNVLPPSYISIDEVRNYIPSELKNGKKVVFKDEKGNEWVWASFFVEDVFERTDGSVEYQHEVLEMRLFDEKDPEIRIDFYGTGLLTDDGTIHKSISAALMRFNITDTQGSMFVNVVFEGDNPVIDPVFDDFRETVTVFSKTFKDVYWASNDIQISEGYTELAINSTVGVVAFRDANNKLWVFDRFE